MSWFLVFLILSLGNVHCLSAETENHHHHHEKNLPSAVIVGTVYCDTCFQDDLSKSKHFISGASVAVECKSEEPKQSFRQEVKTDEHGEFRVWLPSSVSKHLKRIKNCSVELLSSSQPYCAVASSATPNSLRLKSRDRGTHIFSAGFFTFKPENQPEICSHEPVRSEKTDSTDHSFPAPIQDPATPNPGILPDLPPLPTLPNLPPLPPLPLPPLPGKPRNLKSSELSGQNKVSDKKKDYLQDKKSETHPDFFLPPNPLQPPIIPPVPFQPPSVLPPNPLQPPSSALPPLPFQPPPSPLLPPLPPIPNLPPVPGLNPPSPPPSSPSLPIPLPPLPKIPGIPPLPSIPGIPPASSSEKASP